MKIYLQNKMSETSLLNSIWCEKYRPTTLEECLLDDKLRKKFKNLKKLNHFIFHGEYGMGKTSVARILAKKFAPNDYLELNAADENGIDTVRHKIKEFMSYQSFSADYKIVIFNEASYLTKNAQEALRSPLEEYSESCRFIFTANDLNAVDDAIKSRCQVFEFQPPSLKDVCGLVWGIGKKEGITLTSADKDNFVQLVRSYYPDMRKTINEFEKCCLTGSFIWEPAENWLDDLYQMIMTKPHAETRAWFIKNHYTKALDFSNLYSFLFKKFLHNDNIVILISEYLNRTPVDEEINFAAFLIKLERILKNGTQT
jgi:replication factor C small subunit